VIVLLVRVALAAVFAAAGYFKLADRTGTRQTLSELRVPFRLTGALAVAIPLAELAIAAALVPNATAPWGALGALALLAVFSLGIAFALVHDRRPDCNCFGTLHSAPLGWGIVARNVGFAGLAALVYWNPDSLDGLSETALLVTVGAALAAAAFGFQAWFNWQLFRQHGRLIARIQELEQQAAPTTPSRGPKQGEPAPAFELPDLDGESRSLDDLLASGRPLALVFTDPDCGACDQLLPELARLQHQRAGDFEIALVARGTAAENRAKLDRTTLDNVLLQEDREVVQAYGVDAVPTALMVASDGLIASLQATGSAEIERLLDLAPGDAPLLGLVEAGGMR
jgi:methylamine dehydrogenase accessory protein MauD